MIKETSKDCIKSICNYCKVRQYYLNNSQTILRVIRYNITITRFLSIFCSISVQV